MYYCHIKKLLLFLIILLFIHSLIYASFPIEEINENAINTFLYEENKDDEPSLSIYILRGVLFFSILIPGLYFLFKSWWRAWQNQVKWVKILTYVVLGILSLVLLLSIFFGSVGLYNPGG
jgi:heme/copper-type cytochrome/quinol oxidase subunit 3